MKESLNKNIDKHLASRWRGHDSLKGWCSMNYPSTLSNPMLKRKPNYRNPEAIKFSNLNRPISAPSHRVKRPLTAITSKSKRIAQPLPITHNFYNASKAELLMMAESEVDESGIESARIMTQKNEYLSKEYDLAKYHEPYRMQRNVPGFNINSSSEFPQIDPGPHTTQARNDSTYLKTSAKMLTTAGREERIDTMTKLNQKSLYISPLKPIAAY